MILCVNHCQAHAVSSFVSSDKHKLQCIEGVARDVEGSLATLKASPVGALWNGSWAAANTSCRDRGYNGSAGESQCYPHTLMFYHSGEDRIAFNKAVNKALDKYQKRYGLNESTMALLLSCSCHIPSPGDQCSTIDVIGSWLHTNSDTGRVYLCLQGPWQHMIRVLSTLKSSPLMQLHLWDQLVPQRCSDRGYKVAQGKPDHCFPPAELYYTGNEQDLMDCSAYEKTIETGFKSYCTKHDLELDVLDNNPGCNCLPDSEVGHKMPAGTCNAEATHSPIRDWWPAVPQLTHMTPRAETFFV